MDFQHRAGGKTGTGGVASASDANRDRRERLRLLALETIDLNKDPYFMKNHLGSYECKLCLTLHNNEGSYLAHTQGKKHQANLSRRAAKEAKDAPAQPAPEKPRVDIKKFIKIGRPGYKVTKQQDPDSTQQSLLFQIDYPEVVEGSVPRHRFMAAYEQRIEPPDKKWQYLLFAAEPYETIAFKVPSREVDKDPKKFWTHWNKETKQFFLQFAFKYEAKPAPSQGSSAPPRFPSSLPPPPQSLPPPPNIAPRVSGPPSNFLSGGIPPPPSPSPGPNSGPMPPRPFGGPPVPPVGPPGPVSGPGGPPRPPMMGGPPRPMGGPPGPMGGPPMPPGMMSGPPGGYRMGGPPPPPMMGGPPRPPMGMPPPPPMGGGSSGGPPPSGIRPVPPPPPPNSN